MSLSRLNAYRIMWILVLYDLPTDTARQRKIAGKFRKRIKNGGFERFQFSIYLRHCFSRENAEVHIERVKNILPEAGKIGIMRITDKQLEMMEIFDGAEPIAPKPPPQQLEMF